MKIIILIFILFITSINAENNEFTIEDCKNQLNISNIDNYYLNKIYNEVKNNSIYKNCKEVYLEELREDKLAKIKKYNNTQKETGYNYVEVPESLNINYFDKSKKMIELFSIIDKESSKYNDIEKKFFEQTKINKEDVEYYLTESQIPVIEDAVHMFLAENDFLDIYEYNSIDSKILELFPIQYIQFNMEENLLYNLKYISNKGSNFAISFSTINTPIQYASDITISGNFFDKKYSNFQPITFIETSKGTYQFHKTEIDNLYYMFKFKRK